MLYATSVTPDVVGKDTSFFTFTEDATSGDNTNAGFSWYTTDPTHMGTYTISVIPYSDCIYLPALTYTVTVDCEVLSVVPPTYSSLAYSLGNTALATDYSAFTVTPTGCPYTVTHSITEVTTPPSPIDTNTAFSFDAATAILTINTSSFDHAVNTN